MLIKRVNFEKLGDHCYAEIRQAIRHDIGNLTIATFERAMKRVAPCGFRVVRWADNDDLDLGEFIVAIVEFKTEHDWIFFKMRTEL